MKISIITVCFNSEDTIKDTFESVLSQNYKNYEYLVIDGKSTDNTLNIIKEYEKKFKGKLKYISEKDKGLYDAMNKGINMATGDIIGILNSDDIFASNKVLTTINKNFKDKTIDLVYSNIKFMDYDMKKVVRVFRASKGNYKLGWYPPHPTMYIKKDIYTKYGLYNQDYRIAADYDFMLRIMKDKVNMKFIDDYLIYMRSGGVSTEGIKGYYRSFKESLNVLRHNNIRFPLLVNLFRTIKIILQSIKAKIN